MKQIDELSFPVEYRYVRDHTWARLDEKLVRVGITDYAQDQLGEIIYVELPEVGDIVESSNVFGTVESVKAVSELYSPIGGEVVAVNIALRDAPKLVNKSPYQEGWMISIKPNSYDEIENLLTAEDYVGMLREES